MFCTSIKNISFTENLTPLQATDMDSRSAAIQSRSTTSSTSIRDKIVDFDNLRENVTGKLSLENWMVLPSHRSLHIFSLNKMLNGNLSIRNTIFIDVNLVVKVFGEDNDETLFSLKLYSWPQLQTLIEQCGAQVKHEVDLEFIDVVDKSANSVTNTREIKHQQKDTLPDEFCGINTKPEAEVSDLHKTFIELIETSILEDEASGHNSDFVSQGSFFDEAPLLYSEDGYHNTPSTANEIHIRHSQICSICSKSCVVGEMDRHMQQHFNGKLYQCYICGREYRHTHDLERHAKSKHIATRDEFFCDICKSGRGFETKASIEDHMKNRHWKAPIKEQEMNCSACNKDFLTLKQFRTHMRRHEEIKRQPCPICNKSYRCLSRHIKDIHFNIRNHVCDICGSAYKQWNTLKEHIEIQHSPHAEFFCDICQDGKGYRSKGYIKKHFAKVHIKAGQRRKNARKPFYECSFCNVKLPSRYSLKKHVSLPHNDGKHPIFPCKTCDKTFTLKSSLAAHERTHIWHICHESGQPINHPDYLKKHLKQKKDMNKRKCTICPREYARNFDLRNHMEKVHGIVID